MSSLLEQAIVDASALKEAALKSAESSILEKYAPEIKDAVSALLEQEDELGMATMADTEVDSAVVDAAREGMKLCPCPDDDEEVEFSFEELRQEIEGEPPAEEALEEEVNEEEDYALTEEVLEALLETEGDEADEEEIVEEEVEITEENLDSILEELIVDIKPQKSGWAGTPASVMDFNAELELARLASTEAQQEIEDMKQALDNVKKDYAQISESYKNVQAKNKTLVNTVSGLKEKLEEVNLSNARLFYTNRVLNSDSLNERQKNRIAEAISESRSVNEAKVIYNTLQNAVGSSSAKKGPKSLSEAVNRNTPLVARHGSSSSADNTQVERMQRLAGIKNK